MSTNKNKIIIQNLKDSGCDDEFIEKFFRLESERKTNEQMHSLMKYRTGLLAELHECQRKIDCLDYLIFNLKQNKSIQGELNI